MELGDLVGWIAAAVAIVAAGFAGWAAFAADNQARSARKQAQEAEKSRKAAVDQAQSARKQAEEAERSRKTAEQTLALMREQQETTLAREEITQRRDAYRIVTTLVQAMNRHAQQFLAMLRMDSVEGASNAELLAALQETTNASWDAITAFMAEFPPVAHRLPFAGDVLRLGKEFLHGLALPADRAESLSHEWFISVVERTQSVALELERVAGSWAREERW